MTVSGEQMPPQGIPSLQNQNACHEQAFCMVPSRALSRIKLAQTNASSKTKP